MAKQISQIIVSAASEAETTYTCVVENYEYKDLYSSQVLSFKEDDADLALEADTCYKLHIEPNVLSFNNNSSGEVIISYGGYDKGTTSTVSGYIIAKKKISEITAEGLDLYFVASVAATGIYINRVNSESDVSTGGRSLPYVTATSTASDKISVGLLHNLLDNEEISTPITSLQIDGTDGEIFILDGEEISIYENNFYELHDDIGIYNIVCKKKIGTNNTYLNIAFE